MGTAASSIASNVEPGATSSGSSLLSRISVSSVAQTSKYGKRIQELELQVRDLQAQLRIATQSADSFKVPHTSLSPPCRSDQSSSALAQNSTLIKTLSDAAVSSLNRRNEVYMAEVFNRHSEPVGLSAEDLVSALHALDAESSSANVSDVDAVTVLKKFDLGKKGYVSFNEFCKAANITDKSDDDIKDDSDDEGVSQDVEIGQEHANEPADRDEFERVTNLKKARDVFLRFARVSGLSSKALMQALAEVDAPVLLSSQDCSPKHIFHRADANTSGSVDLLEFMRAAELPDDLEMILEDHRLGIIAPALRAYPKSDADQMKSFSKMQREDLFAAVDASIALIKQHLEVVHGMVKKATDTKVKLQEAASKESTKFSTYKGAGGTIDDFFKGLEDRIGSPNMKFKEAMCSEHTILEGSGRTFTSGNYKITTQPKNEWAYVVDGTKCPDMGHGREIRRICDLMKLPLAKKAELKEEEMIAIVLYTGPMFVIYNAILRRYPTEIYEDYVNARNLFPTTIFVLVSAVQKLSRCMDIPSGTLLFRGLGGSMELPDTFFVPSSKCVTPNALGYCEYGFMSTTADRKVAVQYSGVEQGKPKASIMEIHPNSVDRGADISDFSQYPQEKEFLIVPYSFIQGRGRQRTEVTDGGGILSVIPVSVNINLKTETIDELREKKKRLHLSAFKALISETIQWIANTMDMDGQAITRYANDRSASGDKDYFVRGMRGYFLEDTEQALMNIMMEHNQRGIDEYVDNLKYKALVTHMLNVQEWAKQKLMLWLENSKVEIERIYNDWLLSCHRQWLSFLRHQHANTDVGSKERRCAAIKILQCKGLILTDNPFTEKVEKDPIIYAAVADSWAFEDLKFLIDAGANVLDLNADGDSALHAALSNRDEQSAIALVKADADVTTISQGLTPMHIAAQNGLEVCIQLLHDAKADTNFRDENGETPICFAARFGHAASLEVLFQNGADVNQCGKEALIAAAVNGHASCLNVLFKHGTDVKECEEEALFEAAASGDARCLDILFQHGADVRKCGEESLLVAINNGRSECVHTLVQNGAALKNGSTVIHHAAAGRHLDIFLAQGGDVNAQDHNGKTPLHFAAEACRPDSLTMLYEKGSKVDAQDKDGKTPMHYAAASGSESCIKFLCENGANPNAQDKNGKTPMHYVVASNLYHSGSCIKSLFEMGADPNTQDKNGKTPMQYAAMSHSKSCIKSLYGKGADPNAQDKDGKTLMHYAAASGSESCIKFLYGKGADPNAQDKDGKTPMHYAAASGSESHTMENVLCINFLSQAADINAQDNDGKTPLHDAIDSRFEGQSSIIISLIDQRANIGARDR
jgi:ankyrin repeat protein